MGLNGHIADQVWVRRLQIFRTEDRVDKSARGTGDDGDDRAAGVWTCLDWYWTAVSVDRHHRARAAHLVALHKHYPGSDSKANVA